jgi:peptide/nickel transport system ATP-binding protein
MSTLLEIRHLSKSFTVPGGAFSRGHVVRAVDDVSLLLEERHTLGLVGESGCGKSTIARLVMRLATADSGEIIFQGRDVQKLGTAALRTARRDMAMVFQNPYGSLNPRMRIGELVAAPLVIHGVGSRAERAARVEQLLDAVGLPAAAKDRFPHEFSGGQRQRIAIARALALSPSLVICDEATSALDVSVQAQILNLLAELQAAFALTYLFISHNLAVVEHMADTVAVMRAGRIVESGPVEVIFHAPADEYTRTLLAAVPRIGTTPSAPGAAP